MKVKCYGCGHQYEPTVAETDEHADHIEWDRLRRRDIEPLRVIGWLEECQRERDQAIRRAANLAGMPLVVPVPIDQVVTSLRTIPIEPPITAHADDTILLSDERIAVYSSSGQLREERHLP